MKITDFERPQEHPWGMLEGIAEDASEKEMFLVWMLMKCIEAGAFMPIETKVRHQDMVSIGLVEEVSDHTYALTRKAIGLLYGYYGKEEDEDGDPAPRLLEKALPLLEAYWRDLRLHELEEEGYCLACGPDDYCYNHGTQRELANITNAIRAAIADATREDDDG